MCEGGCGRGEEECEGSEKHLVGKCVTRGYRGRAGDGSVRLGGLEGKKKGRSQKLKGERERTGR